MSSAETAVSSQEENSTLLIGVDKVSEAFTSKEIKDALEKGDVRIRADALKSIIRLHVNGESQNHLIMTIIRYIIPVEDHLIKKLVLYFWEVIDKRGTDGNLLPVIILICSFLRNDLLHPNEYVRGLTLRFLCKVGESELIEPLVSAIVQNLSHRVAYVRRHAVLAVHVIYKKFPQLMPDGPELVETAMQDEKDVSTLRNSFDFLSVYAPERAAAFLSNYRDSCELSQAGGPFLMSVVDFCLNRIRTNPYEKARYAPVLLAVLQSKSAAVRYQCASTLLSLASSPTAIRQAIYTYVDLVKTHSDNSVRLIVVSQLDGMRARFLNVMQDSLLEILSILPDASMVIRERVVALAMQLVNRRNADNFMQAMKKELIRAGGADNNMGENNTGVSYRMMIIKAMNEALLRHPPSATSMLPVLLDYVCDDSTTSSEVVTLIKEVLLSQKELRASIVARLMDVMPLMTSSAVLRTTLWIFGAYSPTAAEVLKVIQLLKETVGPFPLQPPKPVVVDETIATTATAPSNPASNLRAVTTVREDGTYVTTYTSAAAVPSPATTGNGYDDGKSSGLRCNILNGDYFLACAVASTLTKLTAQLFLSPVKEQIGDSERNAAQSDAIHIVRQLLEYGTVTNTSQPMDEDTHEQLRLHVVLLSNPSCGFFVDVLHASNNGLQKSVEALQDGRGAGEPAGKQPAVHLMSIDAPVIFTQLSDNRDALLELETAAEIPGASEKEQNIASATEQFLRKLEDTHPLSGFSDPVYCEASITVHQFDVSVDWLLVNRTSQHFTNLTIELVSLGGMKLCERPQTYTLDPHGSLAVKTSLKVSATETGVIYGTVLYDAPNGERCTVILNDIHVDIMNYIRPCYCSPTEFRNKWVIFDWENKITISTTRHDLRGVVSFIVKELNMQLLEPQDFMVGDADAASAAPEEEEDAELAKLPVSDEDAQCGYLCCNLYALTVFGEDALANVSVESDGRGLVSGVVRIRSNTQTIAYGVGEKLNLLHKSGKL